MSFSKYFKWSPNLSDWAKYYSMAQNGTQFKIRAQKPVSEISLKSNQTFGH